MLNNTLMQELQHKEAINAGAFDFTAINKKGKQNEITSYAIIEYDEEKSGHFLTRHHFTEKERNITDAIVTLWLQAQKQGTDTAITPDMIYRNMPGGGDKASPQQKAEIIKTVEFFRRLHVYIDATDEIQTRKVRDANGNFIKNCLFDDYYLTATHARYKTENGGKIVEDSYRINSEPIMLTYARMTGQLLTVDKKYLVIKKVKKGKVSSESLMMNTGRSSMVSYMLRRIAVMKRDQKNKTHKQSNIILFESLFRDTEQTSDNKEINRRNRNFCFSVLDFWKTEGYITDYKKQLSGRSITGIVIIL